MAAPAKTPTPGHPIPRGGKPWIWATWLSKALGGNQCLWAPWFMARFRHAKYETHAIDLAEWNRDHTRLMRDRKQELEECGWRVTTEEQNEFRLEGETAIVVGKPDLIGTLPDEALVIDGKTGRERDADYWQVLIDLYALPLDRRDLPPRLNGEIHYKQGDKRVPVKMRDLTAARRDDIVSLIKRIAGPEPPRSPSRHECERCNIGVEDCPERFKTRAAVTTAVSGF